MSETDPASSLALQEIWRKRLAAAELDFQQASVALKAALQEHDLALITAAREKKTRTRLEYLRVLRIFTDLVVRGKAPG